MSRFFADYDTLVRSFTGCLPQLYPDRFFVPEGTFNGRILLNPSATPDRVNVIVSNGGGCYPLSAGFVCRGMADASVSGNVVAAPSAYDIYEAARLLGGRKGYFLIYNNFMGDYLNNDMAQELLALDQIPVRQCPVCDDLLSAPAGSPRSERTGLSGIVLLARIASGAAAEGMDLDEIECLAAFAQTRMSTLTVTLNYEEQLLELGAGFSGEPPVQTLSDCFTIEGAARTALDLLTEDLKPRPDEELFFLVSRLEKTKDEDAFLLAAELKRQADVSYRTAKSRPGHFTSLLDAHGFFITMLCADDRLAGYLRDDIAAGGFVL